MARRGTGRARREAVLDELEKADPQRHAELVALRASNPQAYRRAVQGLADDYALYAPIRGRRIADDEAFAPGRETDPALQVGAPRPEPAAGEPRPTRTPKAPKAPKAPAKPKKGA